MAIPTMCAEISPGWTIVVPVRGTATSKTRLSMAGVDSSALAAAFGLDVVDAAVHAARVRRVVVTTASPYLAAAASAKGAVAIVDAAPGHLDDVVLRAVDRVRALDPQSDVAVLVGDVATITPGDLDDALALAEEHPRAFIADRDGVGTVMLTARNGLPHQPCFGGPSRISHRAWGYREIALDRSARVRHDIDTAHDLALALELGVGSEVRRVLEAS